PVLVDVGEAVAPRGGVARLDQGSPLPSACGRLRLEPERAALGVAADRPALARVDHVAAELADALERALEVGYGEIRQRGAVAGAGPAPVHAERRSRRVRLHAASLAVASLAELDAEQPLPEPARTVEVVGRELDQLEHVRSLRPSISARASSTATARRRRLACSFNQPLAPDGWGSGTIAVSPLAKRRPTASVMLQGPISARSARPPTGTTSCGRRSRSSCSRQTAQSARSSGVAVRSPRPDGALPG